MWTLNRAAKAIIGVSQSILLLVPMPVAASSYSPKTAHNKPPKLMPLAPKFDNSAAAGNSRTKGAFGSLPEPSPAPAYAPDYSLRGSNSPGDKYGQYKSENAQNNAAYDDADQSSANSSRVTTLLRSAISAYQSGNAALAEKMFRQVLQVDPRNPDAHFSLGAMAESRGDFEGADQHYRDALKASPNDGEIAQAIAALENKMRDQKLAQQKRDQEQAQVAEQERERAQLKHLSDDAAAAYRNGKYDLAIQNLEQVMQQVPNDPDVHYALAQAYRGKGDIGRARFHIGQSVSIDPNNSMYRQVQSSIEQEANARNSQQTANDSRTGNWQPEKSNYYPPVADDSGPAGQITPIAPETNPPANRTEYGYASSASSGLGIMSSLLPGMLGLGLGYGLNSHRGTYNSSTRIKRVVEGSLAGAAAGAAMSALANHGTGSVKQGAAKGALFGGMAGLIFGGF